MVLTNVEQGWRGEEASRPVEQEKVRNVVGEVRIALILIFISFTGACVQNSRNNCTHANFNSVRLSIGVSKSLVLALGQLQDAAIALCGKFKVDQVVGHDRIDTGAGALHGNGVPLSLNGEHGAAQGFG